MILESKYNFGDKVWTITNTQRKDIRSCQFCGGTGKILGNDKSSRTCPECYGKRIEHYWIDEGWRADHRLTIGEIRIETRWEQPGQEPDSIFDNYNAQKGKHEEKYMCLETGIGSGTLHKVSHLFQSQEEAQTECDKRNCAEISTLKAELAKPECGLERAVTLEKN